MERTESKIIQVLPEHENDAIKEMEMFGWSLQSRQEVYLEKGTYPDTSLPIIIMDEIAKTRSYRIEAEHHVKLHFARSLALPNLDRVREIESEYFNLPFPLPTTSRPASVLKKLGDCLAIGGALFLALIWFLMGIALLWEGIAGGLFPIGLATAVVLYLWRTRKKKRKAEEARREEEEKARQIRQQSQRRAEELVVELKKLGYG